MNHTGSVSQQTDIRTPSLIVYGVLLATGTCNLLVPLLVMVDKKLRNPTFVVVSSLAISDLLFIIWRIPFEILNILYSDWVNGTALCKLSYFVNQLTSYAAAYHLVLLSCVRYYILVHPLDAHRNLTVNSALVMCGGLWFFFLLCFIVLLVTSGITAVGTDRTILVCLPDVSVGVKSLWTYSLCYSVLSYFLPLLILIVFHVTKARVVERASRRMRNPRNKQMSAMVVIVLLLFGCLLLPVHLKNLLITSGVAIERMVVMDLVFRCMAYSNSCINPFIYAFISKIFRESICRMCGCVNPVTNDESRTTGRQSTVSALTE